MQLQPGPELMMTLYSYKVLNSCRRLSFVSPVEAGQMDIFGMEYQPMFRIQFMMVPHTISATGTANKGKFYGQSGISGDITTPDQYYRLRKKINVTEGLITVNYAYARYGTSIDPVAKAAHLAADWVRYDNGRTKFWEIGNENAGPWEYGWMIDTSINKDGQPQIISGELYGKHFRIFADSMKAAAEEIGAAIYIGG